MSILLIVGVALAAIMAFALIARGKSSSGPMADAAMPLARQYLDDKRYMEAMVVAKKGIRARPRDLDLRVLLAEVYLFQGKTKRARKVLDGVLQASADHAGARKLLDRLR